MKKLFIVLALLFSSAFVAVAQEEESNRRPNVTFNELESWSRKNNGPYESYTSKDGHTYRREEKVTFGVTSDGKTYRYMWERMNAMHILGGVFTSPISGKLVGKTGVIKNIIVRGNKKTGHEVTVVVGIGATSRIEVRPFEMALESGEIVSQGKTKESAMKELKEAKDMLDLGLITKEQFETKKAELSKYILGK
jgi:hypothetical protein